jgi:hypothetical protein
LNHIFKYECYIQTNLKEDVKMAEDRKKNEALKPVDMNTSEVESLAPINLQNANLRGRNLRDADLRGANLRGANLMGADLRGANLRGADLRGAHLRGADLRGAYLTGANIDDAKIEGAFINLASALSFLVSAKNNNSKTYQFLKEATASQFQKTFKNRNETVDTPKNSLVQEEPTLFSQLLNADSMQSFVDLLEEKEINEQCLNTYFSILPEPVIAKQSIWSKVATFLFVSISIGAILTLALWTVLFNSWNSLSPAVHIVVIIADLLISAVAGLIAVRISFPSSANAGAVQPASGPSEEDQALLMVGDSLQAPNHQMLLNPAAPATSADPSEDKKNRLKAEREREPEPGLGLELKLEPRHSM